MRNYHYSNYQQNISLDLLINNFQYGGYKFEFNLLSNNIYNIEDNIGGVSFEDVWGLYGKGNVDVARRAWNALGDEVRGLVYGHLVGDDEHVGYLEATEVDGRKWRKNFENYLSSECWKQALRERELLNIELV